MAGLSKNPMEVHDSREGYFSRLRADPWGFEDPAYDWSAETRFVAWIAPLYGVLILGTILLGQQGVIPPFNPRSLPYFFAALIALYVGKCLFSWAVLRWDIKINYVRKLGLRPWKKLIAFLVPLVVTGGESMVTDWVVLFLLQCLVGLFTEWNVVRRRVRWLAFAYLSWDRLEDRPYSMRYDQLEDIARFLIYLPFMVLFGKASIIVLIPNLVNQFGDGLAEPVGVRFGRHRYRTRALWYDGQFWAGNFERTLEGSAAVYIVTLVIVCFYWGFFSPLQFALAVALMPPLMTLAEAVSPHTADGPMIALCGCLFLWCIRLI